MKKSILFLLILLVGSSIFGQKDKRMNDLLNHFQLNISKGLDLSKFDTISDKKIKQLKKTAFIELCKAIGSVAKIQVRSEVEAKAKNQKLSNEEIIQIIYDAYKLNIPELKEAYIQYLKEIYEN